MTDALHNAVVERLLADELLLPMLGRFDDRPAIFGFQEAPLLQGAWSGWPWVLVRMPIAGEAIEDKTHPAHEAIVDVQVWAENAGQPSRVGEPAQYLYESLWDSQSAPLDVPGWHVIYQNVSPPTDISSGELLGYAVSLTIGIHRE